jgi:transposase-like protein
MPRKKQPLKDEVVQRLRQPGAPSVSVISEETNIPKPTIYSWISGDSTAKLGHEPLKGNMLMTKKKKKRSPSQKLQLIAASMSLQGEALQTYCSSNGVTLEELTSWRDQALSGIELIGQPDGVVPKKQVDGLEKELNRKNAALAEASALILLQKKTSELLNGEN